MTCPCDSCKFRVTNYNPPNTCPNFSYFFKAFMSAMDGVLEEKPCDKWEAE